MKTQSIIELSKAGVCRQIPSRRIIQVTDKSARYLYIVQSGIIKICNINREGKEVIKLILKSGSIFGELNLLEYEGTDQEIAIALEDAAIIQVPVSAANEIMRRNPLLQKNIQQAISRRIRRTEERMFSIMFKDVKERILEYLKEFVAEFGHPIHGGYQARNFLTHEDIAKITATSRQSVTSSLLYLRKKGCIDYNNKTLSVYHFSE